MSEENTSWSILNFPDDILLKIFSNLSSWDMLSIIGTCIRFKKIALDHSLWVKADFTDGELTVSDINKKFINLPCLRTSTKELHFRGYNSHSKKHVKWKKDLLTGTLLEKISKKAPELLVLSLHEAIINARKLKMNDYNAMGNLKMLSLVKCELVNIPSPTKEGSYFKNIQYILPYLEHLEISYSNWLTDYDLLVLSKLDNLKYLDLKNDIRIGITLAYFSLSFRFGFKSLECINLRGTSLKTADIQSIVQINKLRALYIGPMGVNRKIINESSDTLSLVMSDPTRRAEVSNQVVVISMGDNGPNWKSASPNELEDMGLDWVINGISKDKVDPDKEIANYSHECMKHIASTSKRKHDNDHSPSKKPRLASDDEEEEEIVFINQPQCTSYPIPDENLSDVLLIMLSNNSKTLETLVLNGCAITDAGLSHIMVGLPNLKYIDVNNTFVTKDGLEQAKGVRPDCIFFDVDSE